MHGAAALLVVLASMTQGAKGWKLPDKCDAEMWTKDDRWDFANYSTGTGNLVPMSWHIHYTTNSSEFKRFYDAFVARYRSLFPPTGKQCPFGPNWGSYSYRYVCSLESALEDEFLLIEEEGVGPQDPAVPPGGGGSPWRVPQRAFFIPVEHVEKIWAWASQPSIVGNLDVLLHANTGCMHDDHGVRIHWVTPGRAPKRIRTLFFPCNIPGSGCNDTIYPGPPACGCKMPVRSAKEADSCENCKYTEGDLPPNPVSLLV